MICAPKGPLTLELNMDFQDYHSPVEAINGLRERGFTNDFNLRNAYIEASQIDLILHPEDFTIVEHYRFEGESDPGDNVVIYAIEAKDGIKGVMMNAYGAYAEPLTGDLAKKLSYESTAGASGPRPDTIIDDVNVKHGRDKHTGAL